MKRTKSQRIAGLLLSLVMTVGMFTGLASKNVAAATAPAGYTGLGYIMKTYRNERPQVINSARNLALSNIRGSVVYKNGHYYLHMAYDYETSLDVWGANGISVWMSGNSTPGSFSTNDNGQTINNGNSIFNGMGYGASTGYVGHDGKVAITYEVNGKTYSSTEDKVYVPSNINEGLQSYYGWDHEHEFMLPATVTNVQNITVTKLLGKDVRMTISGSSSSIDAFENAAITHKTTEGGNTVYTVQIDASSATGGVYTVNFETDSGSVSKQISLSRGENSKTVDVTLPNGSRINYISSVTSSYGRLIGYAEVQDWNFSINYNTHPNSRLDSVGVTLSTSSTYSAQVAGSYVFDYKYVIYENNLPVERHGKVAYYWLPGSGSFTDDVTFPANSASITLVSVTSPNGVKNTYNYHLYSNESLRPAIPTEFTATFSSHTDANYYTMIHLRIDYASPVSGTYTLKVQYADANGELHEYEKSPIFNQGYGVFNFGNGNNYQPLQLPGNIQWAKLVKVVGPDNAEYAYDQFLYCRHVYQDEFDTACDICGEVRQLESTGIDGFCERLYTCCLGREAEPEGKDFWANSLRVGVSGAEAAHHFFFCSEFIDGNHSNQEFIRRLYKTIMNRVPADGEVTYWADQIDQGITTRESVFWSFIGSPEWIRICNSYGIAPGSAPTVDPVRAFATRLYATCLGRTGDEAGIENWTNALRSGATTGGAVAHDFFFSDEFVNSNHSNDEFIRRLYRTFMGREGSEEEIGWYMSVMSQGYDREYVFNEFSGSAEFANLCAEAGISS